MASFDSTPIHIRAIITKFLQRETSDEELEILKMWLEEDEDNLRQFDGINDTFQSLVTVTKSNADKSDQAWKKLWDRIGDQKKSKNIFIAPRSSMLLKIAASITLAIVAYFILSNESEQRESILNNQTLVQNSKGNKTSLLLPDSSIVFLNANSTLEYADDFGKHSRTVRLKGEGFFDVRKGKYDFIVITNNLSIHVKGTRFNVSSIELKRLRLKRAVFYFR